MRHYWWYCIIIVVSSVKDEDSDSYICDAQVYVFKAIDFEHAFTKAHEIGNSQEHSYTNMLGDMVSWKFLGLKELRRLKRTDDAVEIYSNIFKHDNPMEFILSKHELKS